MDIENPKIVYFLSETGLPDPKQRGKRDPDFTYPEWLIMLIAILSVKLKIKFMCEFTKWRLNIGIL